MSNVLNLGFIGGGINSAVGSTHFIASQMDGRYRVQSGCFSRNRSTNSQTAEHWGIDPERCYADFQSFLDAEKNHIDALVVLTPTPTHTELVIQAIEHGLPVICEKALASSSIEVRQIQRAQDAHQGFLAVTYNYTGYPMLRELRYRIRNSKFGRIEQIHIEMPQEGFARLNREGQPNVPQQWRLQDGAIPTISLDLGVHLHYIIDFLCGEKPVELVASQSRQGRFRQVIDNSLCIARYSNAIECNIWFSKAALGHRNGLRVRVYGESGSAEWHQMDPEFLIEHDNQGRKTLVDRANNDIELANLARYNRFKSGHPAGFIEAFANHYSDIADCLFGYRQSGIQSPNEFVFTASHALEGAIMLEAMSQSSQERCWKALSLEGAK